MEKSLLLEAIWAIVGHVEEVQSPMNLPGIFPVSKEWVRRFDGLDAAVEQLCKLLGIDINPGSRTAHAGDVLEQAIVWFRGYTNLKFRALTAEQAILAGVGDLMAIDNRSDWLHRMELTKIKAEIAASSRTEVVGLLRDPKPTVPVILLLSWRDIIDALGMPQGAESRRKIIRLNKAFRGPIKLGGKGQQPRVVREQLVDWWFGLADNAAQNEQRLAQDEQHLADVEATAAVQHDFGRYGTVFPAIGGEAKKKRSHKVAKHS